MNAHGQEEIHLTYKIDGRDVIACDTTVWHLSSCPIRPTRPLLRTTEADAVTCFTCKQTDAYKRLRPVQPQSSKVPL